MKSGRIEFPSFEQQGLKVSVAEICSTPDPLLTPEGLQDSLTRFDQHLKGSVGVRIDPNPCRRYRWSEAPCPGCYSGSHVCRRPGGHPGSCYCSLCDKRGRGRDRAEEAPAQPPKALG